MVDGFALTFDDGTVVIDDPGTDVPSFSALMAGLTPRELDFVSGALAPWPALRLPLTRRTSLGYGLTPVRP